MLNDWIWEKVDDHEYRLKDNDGNLVSYLVHINFDNWVCRLINDGDFVMLFKDMRSAEDAIWQATIWIYNECNRIANSFHHIRDHLPNLYDLRVAAEKAMGNE